MNKERLGSLLGGIVGTENVNMDEEMRKHTSFKVGGPADFLVLPNNTEQLSKVIGLCKTENVNYIVIGNGSNLIVKDKGIRGVVIKLFDNFNGYEVKDTRIIAEAGLLMSTIANIALKNELTGLEFASGIPGTIGGAIAMNAGAYGSEIKDVVDKTVFLNVNNELMELANLQHMFGYRTSIIQKEKGIVIKSEFKLKKSNKADIKSLMDDLNKRRREKQPLHLPSAGSVFKRPEGYFAGKLIQDCGLKGYCIGGAEVSELHSGFIVNSKNASAKDIIDLINYIQMKVKDKFGVDLLTEVKIIGED